MGNALFTPDLFSRPNPVFQPVTPDLFQDVKNTLELHYGVDRRKILSVSKLEGLEINSSNFRVDTDSGSYALKRAGKQVKAETMDLQLDISQQLLQNGVGVPHIIKTKDKEFIASDQNSHMWILSDFVEGTYFTGNKSYLQPIAQAIHVLQGLLEKIEDAKKLPLNAGAGTWPKTDIILQELFSCEAEWKNLFPSSEMLALEKEATYLQRCFDKISTFEKDAKKIIAPTHIDLHPHNILIDAQGNPVIVDIDSLQRADKTQCLAFAAFKLLRQYIAYEKPHDAHLAAKQFMDTLEIPRNEIEIWGNAAMAEVLRRIGIIADLNMREANTQWNNVLHMQLAALHEIPHIFKTEG